MELTKDKGLEYFKSEATFNRLHSKIYNAILIKTNFQKQLAEDICYAAYERAIKKVSEGKYEEEDKFISWVLIMAQNLLVDHYRRQSKFKNITSGGYIPFDEFIKYRFKVKDEDLEELEVEVIDKESEVGKLLKEQLKQIPKEQAEIVELVYYKGKKFKQIAKEEKMSINTALGRMRYALINLRKINEADKELHDLTRDYYVET